ncbi:MAG: hypothetical protein A2Y66_07210 [Nitrospirae bacterium RBG_13_41_22]|nr:MAG: hypothetical protein A2Y66_07210 [Nitrospirae bacterium RBG_13_41_22]
MKNGARHTARGAGHGARGAGRRARGAGQRAKSKNNINKIEKRAESALFCWWVSGHWPCEIFARAWALRYFTGLGSAVRGMRCAVHEI